MRKKCHGLVWVTGLLSAILFIGCADTAPPGPEPASPSVEPAMTAPIRWLTNYEEALEEARVQHRRMVLFFYGSDWCESSKRFRENALLTPEFGVYAAENLILVEVDFPIHQHQSEELTRQNEMLYETYGIEEFPTAILLSPEGREKKRWGGRSPSGPDALITWLQAIPAEQENSP